MLDRLGEVIPANNIQASMVVNFDQAGTKKWYIPVTDYVMEVHGIDMIGLDN